MIRLKTETEIALLREGGHRLAQVVKQVAASVRPGVTTLELDTLAANLIKEGGDQSAFLNYKPAGASYGYPATICLSVNEEVVHGIPSGRVLEEGDIVGVDLGLKHQNLFTDMAVTVAVGAISAEARKLLEVTKEALHRAIKVAVVGNTTGDIGHAVESFIAEHGYGLVRDLAGHGVGYKVHEDPQVPNFGKPGQGVKLQPGMVIAIEPMVNLGTAEVEVEEDEYTFITADGRLSAHFEHTIAITPNGPEILTK